MSTVFSRVANVRGCVFSAGGVQLLFPAESVDDRSSGLHKLEIPCVFVFLCVEAYGRVSASAAGFLLVCFPAFSVSSLLAVNVWDRPYCSCFRMSTLTSLDAASRAMNHLFSRLSSLSFPSFLPPAIDNPNAS